MDWHNLVSISNIIVYVVILFLPHSIKGLYDSQFTSIYAWLVTSIALIILIIIALGKNPN